MGNHDMLYDLIGQEIKIDSTILYLGDKQVYDVVGLSSLKLRVRIKPNRLSSLWPENCLVIDENLWALARQNSQEDVAKRYYRYRRELTL